MGRSVLFRSCTHSGRGRGAIFDYYYIGPQRAGLPPNLKVRSGIIINGEWELRSGRW